MNDRARVLKPLGMIEAMAALQHPVTLAELCSRIDEPKPTVHRWLGTLETARLVQRTPDGRRFELAPKAATLAFSILANRPNGTLRHEILRRVVASVGEACNLTILDGTEVSYLDRVESSWPLRISFQQGSRVPAYCSASGKLFLALMRPAKRDLILQTADIKPLTENTIVNRRALLKELAEIRVNGYALDREEFMPGLMCIAVPIYQRQARAQQCVAALAIQAPVSRVIGNDLLEKLPVLKQAAAELADTLTE
jgi:IclR family transcriptional regulator, acetate operon repressor